MFYVKPCDIGGAIMVARYDVFSDPKSGAKEHQNPQNPRVILCDLFGMVKLSDLSKG